MREEDDYVDDFEATCGDRTGSSTHVSANVITVQPGPVEAKQGHNVSLWCKMKYDPKKIAPVTWQSLPNFKTRADDCYSFEKEKYVMSCSDGDPFGYYNLTILDVEWADKGKYRCVYSRHESTVDLQVLVPVTEVTLKKVVTSTATDPLSMHVCITCETNCAYPAARISWFENDQPFSGNTTVTELGCLADKKGQKRTSSNVSMVTGKDKYKDNERKVYNISCTAENIIGEPTISNAIAINYDVTPNLPPTVESEVHSPTAIMVKLIPLYVVVALIVTIITIIIHVVIWRKRHDEKNRPVTRTGTSGRGDLATLAKLLKLGDDGAEVNKEEKEGLTALMIASEIGQCDEVKRLLEHADVNEENKDGRTAIMFASYSGHPKVVEKLLNCGAKVDKSDEDGLTALMFASYRGHPDVVEMLLKKEAEVDRKEKDGWTALMIASKMGFPDIVDALLNARAGVHTKNKENKTALKIAAEGGNKGVIKIFEKHGAVINQDAELEVFGRTSTHPPEGCESLGLKLINLNINDLDDAESDDLTVELHL